MEDTAALQSKNLDLMECIKKKLEEVRKVKISEMLLSKQSKKVNESMDLISHKQIKKRNISQHFSSLDTSNLQSSAVQQGQLLEPEDVDLEHQLSQK